MHKDEFLHKFQLSALGQTTKQYQLLNQDHGLIESAVLIPLIEEDNQLSVLLTKRASHLKHHGGQVCFPGGKVEQQDNSFVDTALREAQEEIGIATDKVKILGQLHPFQTITGFSITPVVALIPSNVQYNIDKNEVAEIFHVPLHHFLQTDKHYTIDIQHKTGNHKVHFMPYEHYNIWGATAAILKDLCNLVTSSPH